MSEREKCYICGHLHGSWTYFQCPDLKLRVCPHCLMWSADHRVVRVREYLGKTKAELARSGVEITNGGV